MWLPRSAEPTPPGGQTEAQPAESKPAPEGLQPGLHVASLSLNYPDEVQVPNAIIRGRVGVGPLALPGRYRITLTVDGRSQSVAATIENDRRSAARDADLQARFTFGLRLRDKLSEINTAVNELRAMRARLRETSSNANRGPRAGGRRAEILEELLSIEDALILHHVEHPKQLHANPIKLNNKLYVIANRVARSDGPPTAAQRALYRRLSMEADLHLQRFRHLQRETLDRAR